MGKEFFAASPENLFPTSADMKKKTSPLVPIAVVRWLRGTGSSMQSNPVLKFLLLYRHPQSQYRLCLFAIKRILHLHFDIGSTCTEKENPTKT